MTATKAAVAAPTQIRCEKCGGMMILRKAEKDAFLGCSNFPKCRNVRPAPPGMVVPADDDGEEKGFQIPFYLGPDDRYPRVLFWALLIMMGVDVALAIPTFLGLLHGNPDTPYYARRLVGALVAMVLPGVFFVPVILGFPLAAALWGGLKLLCMLIVVVGAIGTTLAEQSVNAGPVVAMGLWHAACLAVAIWYFMVRQDG